MHCPSCGDDLVISDRQGIEIDYCKSCRGVWLDRGDRGELDKIIERSLGEVSGPKRKPEDEDRRKESYEPRDHRDYRDRDKDSYGKPKRRESFLSELFDF